MARLVAALLGVALVTAAVAAVLCVLVGIAAVWGVFSLGRWLWRDYRARADAGVHRRAQLLARAEIQHRWYLAGDPRGTFGRFPPARV